MEIDIENGYEAEDADGEAYRSLRLVWKIGALYKLGFLTATFKLINRFGMCHPIQ